ncbi:hypothetical protein Lal_00026583 [Lupinus albus]|nr:hypothetical protein Lal_00026583 [Lupinus albus]
MARRARGRENLENREVRPFAMFVGVNHHKLSIIFGAALLYDETTKTFVWLFNTFSKAIDGKSSKISMTKDMSSPLYMARNLVNLVRILISAFMSMKKRKNLLKLGITCLTSMVLKEMKNGHLFLVNIIFCADMTTTQRSESMNSLIKIYFATSLEPKLATSLEPKLATSLEPKLATSLEPKLATLLEPKLATLLEPIATSLEPKLVTLLEPKLLTNHGWLKTSFLFIDTPSIHKQ